MIELTIATTAYNEKGNVIDFLSSSMAAIKSLDVSSEIIFIDDGSDDGTSQAVEEFIKQHQVENIRLIRHTQPLGITAAIQEIARLSQGNFVALLPSDMESHPANDLPILYRAMDDKTDIVVGWRKNRGDGKVFASSVYNKLNRILFNVDLHDANWIKLIRREKLASIKLHSDRHRFLIPILIHQGCRVKEVETQWHHRSYGQSKFNLRRFPGSLADMLSVKVDLMFSKCPLLFFGWVSFLSGLISIIALFFAIMTECNILWGVFFLGMFTSICSLLIGIASDIILTKLIKNDFHNIHEK